MNTTIQTQRAYAPQFGGNSITESESLIVLLFETYREAGLALADAWDAALADYSHAFNNAA